MSIEMNYFSSIARNTSTNAESSIWYGDHMDYVDRSGEISEVVVGEERRLVLSGLLRIAKLYTSQHERRRELGHDCVTFAYSWESGDMYEATLAARKGGRIIIPQTINRLTDNLNDAPLTNPGEIVYTVDEPVEQALEIQSGSGLHFMVHATADNKEPLYLSKFGNMGPIILTSFEQSLQLYPAQASGIVSDFNVQH